jgi:8-oxo-dGTP pyrophosphatase MutT (NUDIX family)
VDSIAGESAIAADRITAEALRARFVQRPQWIPEHTDEHRMRLHSGDFINASVLIPIILRADGPTLLFTQRTAHLTSHPGQVSFPGGRSEEIDATVIETALRETEEEIGLHRRHIEVIGVLPEYLTATGYRVTPVVGLITPPFVLVPDAIEVAEIFEVPLAYLMNGAHHERRIVSLPDNSGSRTFYAMVYDRFLIWGATAGMLRNLFHFLRV